MAILFDPSAVNQTLYPAPSKETLTSLFVDQPLSVLPTPGAVLDVAVVKRNCDRMLKTCETLGLSFRGHVKSHKTIELTKYQLLGSSLSLDEQQTGSVCVSTIAEAEGLIPLIREGIVTDLLYAFPMPPSSFPRLHKLLKVPFPELRLSVLVDNYKQLSSCWELLEGLTSEKDNGSTWNYGIFVKVDSGYSRAGVHPTELVSLQNMIELATNLKDSGIASFRGVYTHAGHSYSGTNPEDAMWSLADEVKCGLDALQMDTEGREAGDEVTVSVGASPTALVLGNLLDGVEGFDNSTSFAYLQRELKRARDMKHVKIEIHAGVYTILDLQQVATNVLSVPRAIGLKDIALTILAEIASIYHRRSEALVNVGTTGIGREPGPSHCLENMWGLVSSWRELTGPLSEAFPLDEGGWVLKRISQEHGILAWKPSVDSAARLSLEISQKIRIFPQHACIAGSGHGWYYVVDSDQPDGGNVVRDVWVRWRGW
ncbi:hypothetical protein L211DRAFT_136235 [Terfezia boudieri ATCC MYA-4762]|uniref:D-serine dehydratase-like domain-containing protein n=1 Tax=Terfezia boudieri ATCC MYA-4762 TaxID=1051890 RepID=A0A3N4M431_9PEZI|nr:hypothetical protein L211DRAFT_136235 [Terfezia boudieri ATCC MYA-4762]